MCTVLPEYLVYPTEKRVWQRMTSSHSSLMEGCRVEQSGGKLLGRAETCGVVNCKAEQRKVYVVENCWVKQRNLWWGGKL